MSVKYLRLFPETEFGDESYAFLIAFGNGRDHLVYAAVLKWIVEDRMQVRWRHQSFDRDVADDGCAIPVLKQHASYQRPAPL